MYEIPSHPEVKHWTVTADDIRNRHSAARRALGTAA
jgi:hypothetical protein